MVKRSVLRFLPAAILLILLTALASHTAAAEFRPRQSLDTLHDGRSEGEEPIFATIPTLAPSDEPGASVSFKITVSDSPSVCGSDVSVTLADARSQFYYCAIVRNTGDYPIGRHTITNLHDRTEVELASVLAPNETLSVTNALLSSMSLEPLLGPHTVDDGTQSRISVFTYSGSGTLTNEDGGLVPFTTASSASVTTRVRIADDAASEVIDGETTVPDGRGTGMEATQAAPSPTMTAVGISGDVPEQFTTPSTGLPLTNVTATWTPSSPLATPSPTATPAVFEEAATSTPTATMQGISPLAVPGADVQQETGAALTDAVHGGAQDVDVAATEEAIATIAALDATATAVAVSPIDSPTQTPTLPQTQLPSATETPAGGSALLPTGTALAIEAAPSMPLASSAATDSSAGGPDSAITEAIPTRPFFTPTPMPTPDYLLVAAQTFDTTLLAATWIWFMAGSLLFFAVAGVLAGLSFRQSEQSRYELMNRYGSSNALPEEDPFRMPPPMKGGIVEDVSDWPDSLP